ncbi:MAG: hypothetical protein ACRDJ5_00905, partial [Actinomycetota bacterium]
IHDNAKDPRHFAQAFRALLDPHIEETEGPLPVRREIRLRRPEVLEVHEVLALADGESRTSIQASLGDAEIGAGVRLGELHIRGAARIGSSARLRGLACDGELELGSGSSIDRWVDAEGDAFIGSDCDLGVSASSAGVLRLGPGCVFQRLWGAPISTADFAEPGTLGSEPLPVEHPSLEDSVVWGRRWMSLPVGTLLQRDLVIHGDLHIARDCVIEGSIKAHGSIFMAEGVKVGGSVISRRRIHLSGGTEIEGNVFAERDLFIGPNTRIGRYGHHKSAYSSGVVTLSKGVLVFGWLFAERGGKVARG